MVNVTSFVVSIMGLAAAGVVFLVAVILAIVFAVKKQRRPAAILGGVAVGSFLVACLMVGLAVRYGIKGAVAVASAAVNRPSPAEDLQRQRHIAKLKSYVPPDVLANVPETFYTYEGFRDWWRFPLVYPYDISMIDSVDSPGWLRRYAGGDIADDRSSENVISGITHLSFDGKYLLAHAEPSNDGAWILFEFSTGTWKVFRTRGELIEAAKAAGYTGDTELQGIGVNYRLCFSDKGLL